VGDVELVDVREGVVTVRLTGACRGCPMSQMTLKNGIEKFLKKEIPEVVSVQAACLKGVETGRGRLETQGRDTMKIVKIDHLGVAVKSIDAGRNFWTDVLGLRFEGTETVAEQKVTTAFFPVGESEVELLESTAPGRPDRQVSGEKGARASSTSPFVSKTSKRRWPSSRPRGSN
jgi:hypothetical protein